MNSALDGPEFDKLVADVLDNPEMLLSESLSPDQVLGIQRRLNPYARVAGPPDGQKTRIAACSYTNLRVDYIRRLTMTSLVGFIFQMLHEWDIPAEQRRFTLEAYDPKAPESAPADPQDLVSKLEAALAIATRAAEEGKCVESRRHALSEATVNERRAACKAELAAAESRAAGLLYAATHASYRVGVEAGHRLAATAAAGKKHAEVRAILDQYPPPSPPSTQEMPAAKAKAIIDAFLRNWLQFDPSIHVRSGCNEKALAEAVVHSAMADGTVVAVDSKDLGHLTLEALRGAAPPPAAAHRDAVAVIYKSRNSYNAIMTLLRDEELAESLVQALGEPEAFLRYLSPVPEQSRARVAADTVPPQDTFHRWDYYTEVNYEELRTITEALYPERPDLDWALAIWDSFAGTEAETKEAFDKYCQKYQNEVPSSIHSIQFGAWSILADFKENRDKIQFYNKNTEVLKRILDRHAEDKKIGAELMRQRVRAAKAKNIAEDGPDAPGLRDYKRVQATGGKDLASKGVEKVISAEEMRRLELARGNLKAAAELEMLEQYEKTLETLEAAEKARPLSDEEKEDLANARRHIGRIREMAVVPEDAIQVDVFTTNAATGTMSKSHFYTKAVEPEKPQDNTGAASTTQPLAPYAVEYMRAELAARSDTAMHAEALRDAEKK